MSDHTAALVFWTPICLAVLVFLGSILREHWKDRKDRDDA